jgi:diguanylate cyclase (GGDEF)-like protein
MSRLISFRPLAFCTAPRVIVVSSRLSISMVLNSSLPPKILVIDDDIVVRMKISQALDLEGFKVILAKDGSAGIMAYLEHCPDLVLVDAVMPLVDGFEFCENLKKIESNRLTPILMITSLDDDNSVEKAFAAGANDYITKPVNMVILRQRVKNMVLQSQQLKDRFKITEELQQDNRNLKMLANLDSLTKLTNRRGFEQEWSLMQRVGSPLSVIMCDIDFFKSFNDTYGHPAGDRCLVKVGEALRQAVRRPDDLVARYGGEEFVVVLPNTDALGAMFVAENIRSSVKNLQIVHKTSTVCTSITMSLGVSTTIPTRDRELGGLLESSDRALYTAKSQGRNRVVMAVC